MAAELNQMKNLKAAGPKNVQTELLKLLKRKRIKMRPTLFNKIYTFGNIPSECLKSQFIVLRDEEKQEY